MTPQDKRDFREETALNAAEESLLIMVAGRYGVSKSAALRIALHIVGDNIMRKDRLAETGEVTDF